MTGSSNLSDLLQKALKELSAAMKAIAFYPSHHPSVVSTLERLVLTLREALAIQDSIQICVAEAAFLFAGKPIAEEDRMLAGFAAYLSRRGIGALVFRTPLEGESLKGLLEVLTLDPGTLQARGGPARCLQERRLGGVSIEEFDAAAALRTARTDTAAGPAAGGAKRAGTSWSDLLARFLAGRSDQPPPGGVHLLRRVAGDAKAARELMASLQAVAAEVPGPERGRLMTAALGRIAAEVAGSEPEALPALAGNLARALSELDPKTLMELLGASIPIPGTGLDLGREIRAHIPDDQIGQMIVKLVQFEGKLTARLTSVVRKVLIDAGGIDRHRDAVKGAVREARRPDADPLTDIWESIENLLDESQDDWISREYKGLLELLGAKTPALEEATRRELESLPGFREDLSEVGISRRAFLLFGDILAVDYEPARLWVALDQIEKRSPAIVPEWYAGCVEVAGLARALLEAARPPEAHVREAGTKALQAVAAGLVESYRKEFHGLAPEQREALARAFDALGPHGVEALLGGLEKEEDWEIRKTFLAYLSARRREAVPALLARLGDRSWYLVRNVLVVLGEIGDPTTVPPIASTLKHPEPRVRRDAVAALGKIGGPRAFALVRECLDDPEVVEVAMRCLAVIDRPRTISAFLDMTARVDLLGRRNGRLREAILALGTLGAHESIPRLQEILMRGFWLPPSAGDPVRIAAARALEKIGTTAALRVVARGTRLWRRPVRAVCSEIVGGRPVSAADDLVN